MVIFSLLMLFSFLVPMKMKLWCLNQSMKINLKLHKINTGTAKRRMSIHTTVLKAVTAVDSMLLQSFIEIHFE